MDVRELKSCINSFHEKEKDEMNKLRAQCYWSVAPHLEKNITMEKFMKFPWDKEKIINKKTKEQQMALANHLKKYLK